MSRPISTIDNALTKRPKQKEESLPVTFISPAKSWAALNLAELWHYRDLLYILAWRDIKVRYKQTAIGAAWVILQPLLTMVVFSILFGELAGFPSGDVPYPVFTYTALLPWQLFAHALTASSTSLVANQQLITKVYFPRLVIPLASVVSGMVDFFIAFLVLLGMMWLYNIPLTTSILAMPVFLLLAVLTALAAGLWLSAMNVQYRDVGYTLPFLTQFLFFVTPVAYSSAIIPRAWQALYGLNPMAGVVEGFRWALLGESGLSWPQLLASTGVVILALVSGLFYFRRMEDTFADVI
jgi:lipopolysaccharide transport system permease protein